MSHERAMADAAAKRPVLAPRNFDGFTATTFVNHTVELLAYMASTQPPAWMRDGRCYDTANPDAWFPGPGQHNTDAQAAVAICRTCPVQRACLTYATERHLDGVWGGTTETARREQRRGAA